MVEYCVLVTGPESSGTRWITNTLAKHPEVIGGEKDHTDILDSFWAEAPGNPLGESPPPGEGIPRELLKSPHKVLLTRRSIPSGKIPGKSAKYMDFDDFARLKAACDFEGLTLILIITSRSPVPNILSCCRHRDSVQGSVKKAFRQYWAAYQHVFRFIEAAQPLQFIIVSLEGMIHEGSGYLDGIFHFLGLEKELVEIDDHKFVNEDYYEAIYDSKDY